MSRVPVGGGLDVHSYLDDFSRPWQRRTPAVLLHAYGRHGRFWDPWVPLMADRRVVLRPEVPGCGLSSVPPPDHVFEVQQLVDAMISVLDHHDLRRVHWVGEASGGMVGLVLALQHPERLASLTLCNTSVRVPRDKVAGAYTLGERTTVDAIRNHGVADWVAATIDGRVDTAVASPSLVRWMVDEMSQVPEHVAVGLFECFSALDLSDDVVRVTTPTLLLAGGDGPVAAHHRELAVTMPNARSVAIPGCGHGVNYVRPRVCAAETLAFLDEVEHQADG